MIKKWLQLFRAQTAPLTVLTVMAAYFNGESNIFTGLILIILLILSHYMSYGHNSLMDTAMCYDTFDINKRHHPINNGTIDINTAHKVIHIGMILVTILVIMVTVMIAINPIYSLVSLILWIVFGQAYNDGMSKESILAIPIISIQASTMISWGWFLSHKNLDIIGLAFIMYNFVLIFLQISFHGSLKDIKQSEKSSLITRLGTFYSNIHKKIIFTKPVIVLESLLKVFQLIFLLIILYYISKIEHYYFYVITIIPMFFLSIVVFIKMFDTKLTRKELMMAMSIEQIFSIYAPLPLLINDMNLTIILLLGGFIYDLIYSSIIVVNN